MNITPNISKQNKSAHVPINIARETIKLMAVRQVEPTPENYQLIYNELADIPSMKTWKVLLEKHSSSCRVKLQNKIIGSIAGKNY